MGNKFKALARWGYAARGVVYVILGALALMGALGGGSTGEASTEGALSTLLAQPFGRVLLAAVAIGLVGHVLWRFAQAFLNADHLDHDAKGYLARASNFANGLANAVLAFAAARLVLGSGSGSGSDGSESLTAWLMQQPFGRFAVGAVGAAIVIGGAVQAWTGISKAYQEKVKLPAEHETVLHGLSVFGLAARGLLLAVTGGFLVYAALTVDPQQAGSLTEAMDWVRQLPFGAILYTLAAAGLVAFGIYSFIQARYRVVDAPRGTELKQTLRKIA